MKSFGKIVDRSLNGLSLFVAILFFALLARHYLSSSAATNSPAGPQLGALLTLPNTDWGANHYTLVVALQAGCQWCEASADFYRDLVRSNSGTAFHTVAVLPQTVPQATSFLRSINVKFTDVRQLDLFRLGVQSTPTLILVDNSGHVDSTWIGKLSPKQEETVFDKLGVTRVEDHSSQPRGGDSQSDSATTPIQGTITATELKQLQADSRVVPIVDIRPRQEYTIGHIYGSINIPEDELEARAPHEIPKGAVIVVYCHYCPPCESLQNSKGIATVCSLGEAWFQKLGFAKVRTLAEDLSHLQGVGVSVVGDTKESFTTGSNPVSPSF